MEMRTLELPGADFGAAIQSYSQGGVVPSGPAPALTVGTWTVRVRTSVNGNPSALSNAITITVP